MNQTELVSKLKNLVREERKITAEILNHLCEVEIRKIFAYMGYPSLFEFCLKELGYSEGAAQRRISAMRLIKELPQVEEKIIAGTLSLSVVSQAQTFFKKKKNLNRPMAKSEKLDLLLSLENTSTRECEKTLLRLEPEMATKDKERYLSPETLEIKITVDREFIENLEALKNQLSHQMPEATTKDILAFALKSLVRKLGERKSGVEKLDLIKSDDVKLDASKFVANNSSMKKSTDPQCRLNLPPAPAVKNQKSRYISIHAKRTVWQKDEGKCQYTDPKTGRRCESKRFLEIDHIVPKSYLGSNHADNLQLLCDTHNRLKGALLSI